MKDNILKMFLDRSLRYKSREVFRQRINQTKSFRTITWDSLESISGKVSCSLLSLGTEVFDNIGIFSDNKPEWIFADLGIMGVRGVTVPFYSTSSKQQLKYIVDETRMKLIFVGNQEQYEKAVWLLENTATLRYIVVFDSDFKSANENCLSWETFIDLDTRRFFEAEVRKRTADIETDDLVTIIYTSGTTGESKGAMLNHSSFMYTFRIHDERLDVRESDVSVCFLPLSHVFERMWTYYMLYKGATNVFIDNPREIINHISVIKPTVMCTVPRFFEKTFEGIQSEKEKWSDSKMKIFDWSVKTGEVYSVYLSRKQKPPISLKLKRSIADLLVLKKLRKIFGGKIRYLPCAGAAISPSLLRFFHAAGIFINYGYGATETSATVSCFRDDRYDFDTCGTTMPGIEVKISNEGEILVKGGTLFIGYFNKPDETAKTLIDGWYHSGDQGYVTSHGDLVMTDRIKDLMKTSSGKYVSPQKIELLFSQDPYIEQIIVIGDNRKYVTALIVPSFPALKSVAEKIGLKTFENAELILHSRILEFYTERIRKIQEELANYERVIRFKLLPEPFSIQNGMLTNSLKIRRSMLIEKFKDDIDKMYLS